MNITFVIGAGASKDLNGSFPIGTELAESIEGLLNGELEPGSSGPIASALSRTPHGLRDEHIDAMRRIRDSILSEDSIDDFLSAWSEVPHIDEVAKLAIAHLILDAERRSALFIQAVSEADRTSRLRHFNNTWLGRIIRRPGIARRNIEDALSGISFIVFNYDRVLEQYLKLYSRHVLGKTEAEADNLLNQLSIAHAYGSLGEINEHMPVQFGAQDIFVPMAAKNIRTYNEDHPSDNVDKIRKLVASSSKIIFLGCNFHQQNLELIFGEPHARSDLWLFGSTYKMTPLRQQAAETSLRRYGSAVTLEGTSCSDFLDRNFEPIFR